MTSAGINREMGGRGRTISMWQSVASLAVGLTGIAAAAGVFRFAGIGPAKPIHEFLTQLAMFVSMPLLGLVGVLAYVPVGPDSQLPALTLGGLVLVFFAFRMFPKQLTQFQESYVLMTGLFGIMCVFFRSAFILAGQSGSESPESNTAAWYGVIGCGLVILAAWVTSVNPKGSLKFGPLSMLRVDIFHYLMAVANICLVHLFQGMWQ